MKTSCYILSKVARVVILALASLSVSLRAGIPEPDLVWYGKVLTVSGGNTVRVTSGTLTWQIEPLIGGAPWSLSTPLTNINDQFSFILRVPCETPETGVAATTGKVLLTTPVTGYRRVTVTLDGQLLTLINAPDQFAPMPTARGGTERIDLAQGTLPADTDGDGLADVWEQQYFGSPTGANPNDDPDGDGMTNLQEYRAGTNPTDPQSRFAVMEIKRVSQGIRLRWSSQTNRTYRVLRSPTLLASPDSYQTIQIGVAATPLINEFLDTTTAAGTQFFYRIKLDE